MTKYLFLVLFLFTAFVASDASAQKKKPAQQVTTGLAKIDTLTIGGLRPGDLVAAFQRVTFDLDTVFWQGPSGANMMKGTFKQFGENGECRITTREGEIQQVAFNMVFADSNKARQTYDELESVITGRFGEPKDAYHNVHMMTRWVGDKRILSLKGMDGANTLSLTLTLVPKTASKAAESPKTRTR
jgi:hypothetical protein